MAATETLVFKTAFDIAKRIANLVTDAKVKAAVADLNEALFKAQGWALEGQARQSALVEEVSTLKTEIADLKAWNAKKQRYELKAVHAGVFAYCLKEPEQGSEPLHWICQPCYENGVIAILQEGQLGQGVGAWNCPNNHPPLEFFR